jgi:integrase/recombinase XerD
MASDRSGIDLMALFHEFKRDCKIRNLAEPTVFNYEDSFKRFYRFLGEPKTVRIGLEEAVKEYIEYMQGRDIKAPSINHYLRDLRAFLYYLMGKGYILKFKIIQLRAQEAPPDPYSLDQLRYMIPTPESDASFCVWRTWMIIYWILDTGNREATVCNIKMQDLDGQTVRLTHTKNKKGQIIELSAQLMPMLHKYIRKFRDKSGPDDYLFPSIYNRKLTENALKHSLSKYNRERGVSKTSGHDLRKTYTSMALASGETTEQEVADRLGHGNTALLKRYAHFTRAEKKKFHEASTPLNQLVVAPKRRIGRGGDR